MTLPVTEMEEVPMKREPAEIACECLSSSVLDQILEREASLMTRIEEATRQAEQTVEVAQDSVPRILQDGSQEALKRAEEEVARIRAETDRTVEEIDGRSAIEVDELRARLSANIPVTVEYIVSAVCGCERPLPASGGE